jgi:hypothetical protein
MSWTKKKPVRWPCRTHEEKASRWLHTFRERQIDGRLLALDETSFVVGRTVPGKGYSPRGQQLRLGRDFSKRKRFTLLVCLESNNARPIHHMLVEGSITGQLFQQFIATMPDSVRGTSLLLDNAAIHHAKRSLEHAATPSIATTAENKGVELIYIPPYSPQFNPVELFSHR